MHYANIAGFLASLSWLGLSVLMSFGGILGRCQLAVREAKPAKTNHLFYIVFKFLMIIFYLDT